MEEKVPEKINLLVNMVNVAFLILSVGTETVLIASQRSLIDQKLFNLYIIAQLITGMVQRASVLCCTQLIAILFRAGPTSTTVLALVLCCTLALSQLLVLKTLFHDAELRDGNILANTARCHRISFSSGFFANALLSKKILVDPSQRAILQR
jgi:hypothetical protein